LATGKTVSVDGAAPKVHCNIAPFTTIWPAMKPTLCSQPTPHLLVTRAHNPPANPKAAPNRTKMIP
jgi:hypothetical protein